MAPAPPPTAVSAPGKIFLAGGYLVLDRKYTALVFGLDARIHVHVRPLPTPPQPNVVIVTSPQFKHAVWQYAYELPGEGAVRVTQVQSEPSSKNPFVETALTFALNYVSTLRAGPLEPCAVTILADNDYYSHTGSPLEGSQGRFLDFGVTILDAHKTGLGSSAALVTAFTAAIVSYYLPRSSLDITTESGRSRLHNLAQASHCAAQGKVGSGFDVAAAVYGSCLYRRFTPSILEHLGEPGSTQFTQNLKSVVENTDSARKWDTEVDKSSVGIPKGIRLVMCDVDCGSQTVGMVKKVLGWRKGNPDEANGIWDTLQTKNEGLRHVLYQLEQTPPQERNYESLRGAFTAIRGLIRDMSTKSGVPIEPESQTSLLDACSSLPGVLGGVVPGAGGFDAIALLIEDKPKVLDNLHKLVDSWKVTTGESSGKVRMLGVREEFEGVRIEDANTYGSCVE